MPGARGGLRAGVAAVLAGLLALSGGTGAAQSADATRLPAPGECEVIVVGDSLVAKSPGTYVQTLSAAGWAVRIVSESGQSTLWGYRAISRLMADDPRQVPAAVVVALGTNDTREEGFTFATMRKRIGQYRQLLGPDRTLLWVDLALWDREGTMSQERLIRVAEANRALSVVASRGNIVGIDWSSRALLDPVSVFRLDGVHYLPEGYRMRAEAIAEALGPSGCATT